MRLSNTQLSNRKGQHAASQHYMPHSACQLSIMKVNVCWKDGPCPGDLRQEHCRLAKDLSSNIVYKKLDRGCFERVTSVLPSYPVLTIILLNHREDEAWKHMSSFVPCTVSDEAP